MPLGGAPPAAPIKFPSCNSRAAAPSSGSPVERQPVWLGFLGHASTASDSFALWYASVASWSSGTWQTAVMQFPLQVVRDLAARIG